MTRKTKHLGRESGRSSDRYLSPQQPYTGDGYTRRKPHDSVVVKFLKAVTGKKK